MGIHTFLRMEGLITELGLLVIGAGLTWLIILVSQWSRRSRLSVCLDHEEVPRTLEYQNVEVVEREILLTVRNLGVKPAVDCVGRLERVELYQDGKWEETNFTASDLAWRGSGGARTATIPSDAPPRQLRLLRLTKHFGDTLQAFVCYADPSDAPPVPPDLDFDAGVVGPNQFRFTVWVQPEGGAGDSARCLVEIDWRRPSGPQSSKDLLVVEATPTCDQLIN